MTETNQEFHRTLTKAQFDLVELHLQQAAESVSEIANRDNDCYDMDDRASVMAGLVKVAYALRSLGIPLGITNQEFWDAIEVRIGG